MEEAERLCDRVAIMDHGKVIALGTPRELIAGLGAEHVVEFAVGPGGDTDPAGFAAAGLAPLVRHDDSWRLQVSELHQAMPAVLTELRRQGVQLSELRTHSATLEDVFVALTGRQLRDG
jgi:ABC-2 type transport system ATP-binding protein